MDLIHLIMVRNNNIMVNYHIDTGEGHLIRAAMK